MPEGQTVHRGQRTTWITDRTHYVLHTQHTAERMWSTQHPPACKLARSWCQLSSRATRAKQTPPSTNDLTPLPPAARACSYMMGWLCWLDGLIVLAGRASPRLMPSAFC